jgi:hypothetical protein
MSLHRDGGTAAGGGEPPAADPPSPAPAEGAAETKAALAAANERLAKLEAQLAQGKQEPEIDEERLAAQVATLQKRPKLKAALLERLGAGGKDAAAEELRSKVTKLEEQSAARELLILKTNLLNQIPGATDEHLKLLSAPDEDGLRQQAEVLKKTLAGAQTTAGQIGSGRVSLPPLGGGEPKKTLSIKEAYDLAG